VPDLRHPQFCPLARAAEILGHRWVLLVLRELAVGPQRFSDLRRRLSGVSTSVLAERLAALEGHGIVRRRALPPPAASSVYELTPLGRGVEPVLLELARFGLRFLGAPEPGDHVEADWIRLAVRAFARRGPVPARRFELRVRGAASGERPVVLRLGGGDAGTRLLAPDEPVDATLEAPVLVVMGLLSGALPATALAGRDDVRVDGDARALAELPALFDMDPRAPVAPVAPDAASSAPETQPMKGSQP
jgi:DNA-binding HxlR family transcriptional regulator